MVHKKIPDRLCRRSGIFYLMFDCRKRLARGIPAAGAHATAAATSPVYRRHGCATCVTCRAVAEEGRERPHCIVPAAIWADDGVVRVDHRAELIETDAAIVTEIFVQRHAFIVS